MTRTEKYGNLNGLTTNQRDLIANDLMLLSVQGKAFGSYDEMVETYIKRFIIARESVEDMDIKLNNNDDAFNTAVHTELERIFKDVE